jgi:hypothetical protein
VYSINSPPRKIHLRTKNVANWHTCDVWPRSAILTYPDVPKTPRTSLPDPRQTIATGAMYPLIDYFYITPKVIVGQLNFLQDELDEIRERARRAFQEA